MNTFEAEKAAPRAHSLTKCRPSGKTSRWYLARLKKDQHWQQLQASTSINTEMATGATAHAAEGKWPVDNRILKREPAKLRHHAGGNKRTSNLMLRRKRQSRTESGRYLQLAAPTRASSATSFVACSAKAARYATTCSLTTSSSSPLFAMTCPKQTLHFISSIRKWLHLVYI